MAVEIGALRALLSLDSAAFESGVKRAQASMTNLQRSLSRTGDRMKRIGRDLSTKVTLPIATATGLMVRSSINAAFEIERLSKVANAGTTEFQRFSAGAKDVGIEQDKLADILKDTNDRIGDFVATGAGPMADFFENIAPKVGVTAKQFEKLSGPEALQLYVSSLEKAGASQQEMTFYMEALASDATLLLPLLRNNGKEMERLGNRAENLGAVMDAKTIKALNASRDSMRDLRFAAVGLGNQVTAALAPAMEWMSQKAIEAAEWFSELSPRMQRFTAVAGVVAASIGPLAIALGFVATGMAALASPIGLAVLAFGAVAGAAAYVATQWDELKARFPVLERVAGLGAEIKKQWEDLPAIKWALLIPALRWARFIPGLRWAAFVPKIAWGAVAGTLKWGALIGRLSWAALRVIPGIGWAALAGTLAWSALVKKVEWNGWIPKIVWADWIPKVNWSQFIPDIDWGAIFNSGGRVRQRAEQLGRDFGSGLNLGIMGSRPSSEAEIRDYMDSMEGAARDKTETQSPSKVWMRLGQDLMDGLRVGIEGKAVDAANAAAEAAKGVTDAVGSSIKGLDALRSGAKTVFRDVLTGARSFRESLSSVLGSFADRLMNNAVDGLFNALIPGFATGTSNFAGGLARVNEQGGEIMNLPRGTQIIPHDISKRMADSGGSARVEIVVRNEPGTVVEIARKEADQITSVKLTEMHKALPDMVQQIQNDPWARSS